MKQITIISGKGGTGKTTLTSAFISLATDAVFADCDVDAPDLHIILQPEIKEIHDFYGLELASLDKEKCIECGECVANCRFNAIADEGGMEIIESACEGCGVCEYVCPVDAITMKEHKAGKAYISNTRFGMLSHAHLNIAEESSGKLVSVVRNNARLLAEKYGKDLVIIDGPPGIGCPVTSSITGVDLVLIVTEPTMSSIHDLKRVLGVVKHFNIPAFVCINKYNINLENTEAIEKYCRENYVEVVGKLPYNTVATEAMIKKMTIIEYSDGDLSQMLKDIWSQIEDKITNYKIG